MNSMLFTFCTWLVSKKMLFSIFVPMLNSYTCRYHVKHTWPKHDTPVIVIAQLKLIILEHVNMAWTMYILTGEHCVIC